jgi:hypothetical protein
MKVIVTFVEERVEEKPEIVVILKYVEPEPEKFVLKKKEEAFTEPVTLWIENISRKGVVLIEFSEQLIVPPIL